jgi:hypothetical protein
MTHGSISRRSWQGRGHGDHRAPLSLLSPTPAPSLDCHLNSCVELCHFETCSQVRRPCPGTGAQGSSVRGVCRWRDGYFAPEGRCGHQNYVQGDLEGRQVLQGSPMPCIFSWVASTQLHPAGRELCRLHPPLQIWASVLAPADTWP